MRVGTRVIVDVGDNFSTRFDETCVAGCTESGWWRLYDSESGSLRNYACQSIRGAIVNDDEFEVWIFEFLQPFNSILQSSATIVSADNYRNHRPFFVHWEGNHLVGVADTGESWFWLPLTG